jgi:biopolymer transport protein ExbD
MRFRFGKKRRIDPNIPTGSMADISFLLIIFFMVSTVFVVYRGFPVNLPVAESIDILKSKRNVVNIWIAPDGRIVVDEYEAGLADVGGIVRRKLDMNPRIVVLVKSDRATPYRQVSGVIEELKRVEALRVSFVAKKE